MRKLLLLVSSAFLTSSMPAQAAFNVIEMHAATESAVVHFLKNNPAHADHLFGYKTWKSGEDVKVKVYVTHAGLNMEFNYVCHKHETNIECHFQP